MPEYDEPDMLRLPLFNTILRLKVMNDRYILLFLSFLKRGVIQKVAAQDDAGFVSPLSRPSEALGFAIDPPSHSQISGAYEELFKFVFYLLVVLLVRFSILFLQTRPHGSWRD